MAQTRSNTNRQDQIQTVHVALRKTLVQKIKATAALNRRSLNAQVAMLVERAFALDAFVEKENKESLNAS